MTYLAKSSLMCLENHPGTENGKTTCLVKGVKVIFFSKPYHF